MGINNSERQQLDKRAKFIVKEKMAPVAKVGSAFWRQAGLSYVQYLSIASRAVRASLKVKFLLILDVF